MKNNWSAGKILLFDFNNTLLNYFGQSNLDALYTCDIKWPRVILMQYS